MNKRPNKFTHRLIQIDHSTMTCDYGKFIHFYFRSLDVSDIRAFIPVINVMILFIYFSFFFSLSGYFVRYIALFSLHSLITFPLSLFHQFLTICHKYFNWINDIKPFMLHVLLLFEQFYDIYNIFNSIFNWSFQYKWLKIVLNCLYQMFELIGLIWILHVLRLYFIKNISIIVFFEMRKIKCFFFFIIFRKKV